ncbi:MAG: glycosyltransferase family 39 protein [Sedimenticola sp.]
MSDLISRWLPSRAAIIIALLLAFFWQIGSMPLYDVDEGAFTEATREMMESGNYVSTYLDGVPRHDKPILIYWFQAASVAVFGLNEFALRLPSALACLLWALVLFRFTRRHTDLVTAQTATLLMALAFYVGMVAKAAIADGLLNLFLALALLDIYQHYKTPSRIGLLRIFAWLGLGFITKGPVAVLFPFLASAIFYGTERRLADWARAVFNPLGIALFLAIVVPWHILVYLDQGMAFFEGFYLKHNLSRYSDAMEGHSGSPFYYAIWIPVALMPFAGWIFSIAGGIKKSFSDPLERFLWIWFLSVFIFFSFSSTKLPHYALYGATPLFFLMALHREKLTSRWLAFTPPLLFFLLLAALPFIFGYAHSQTGKLYEQTLFSAGQATLGSDYLIFTLVMTALLLVIAMSKKISSWQGLILAGFLQAFIISGFILPRVMDVLQAPVKKAAVIAKTEQAPVVSYGIYMPSFSVYRDAITEKRTPRPGDLVFVRIDKLERLFKLFPKEQCEVVFREGTVALVKISAAE